MFSSTSGQLVTSTSTANAWRWGYAAPADVRAADVSGVEVMRGLLDAAKSKAKQRQLEQQRATGLPGELTARGHAVALELRKLNCTHSTTRYGAVMTSAGVQFNWMGNPALARWCGFSDRTARRARAELAELGLVQSHLLLPGQFVEGMRSPVQRPRVVRDVSQLHRLVGEVTLQPTRANTDERRAAPTTSVPPLRRGAPACFTPPSKTRPPPPPPRDDKATAAELEEILLREVDPEFRPYLEQIAAARRNEPTGAPPKPPPNAANPAPSPELIDEWDRTTSRMEQQYEDAQRRAEQRRQAELEELERNPRGPPN